MNKIKIPYPPEIAKALTEFQPRKHQKEIIDAIEKHGYKKLIINGHRRFGKDLTCLPGITVRQALKRVGNYVYLLPTHKQARQVIYKGMTLEGKPFMSYIPRELIKKNLSQEMSVELVNGSQILIRGSNNPDSYRGISCMGAVFSEAAYQHPDAYSILSPSLLYNDGWSVHISTPFGENHFYDLYQRAQLSDKWFARTFTIEDTGLFTPEQIQQEILDGTISEHLVQQEYFCRFDVGSEGSIYAKYVNELYLLDQIGEVPWDRGHRVHTAWDIGVDDYTAIVFFQCISNHINIIDFILDNNKPMEHYIKLVLDKPYIYGTHLFPHDGEQRQKFGLKTMRDMADDLGLRAEMVDQIGKQAGIEKVRAKFNRFWIDEVKCKKLITCMKNYHRKWDPIKGRYGEEPVKDMCDDAMDALRYMCVGESNLKGGMTALEAQALRNKALYGTQSNDLPKELRGNNKNIHGPFSRS